MGQVGRLTLAGLFDEEITSDDRLKEILDIYNSEEAQNYKPPSQVRDEEFKAATKDIGINKGSKIKKFNSMPGSDSDLNNYGINYIGVYFQNMETGDITDINGKKLGNIN